MISRELIIIFCCLFSFTYCNYENNKAERDNPLSKYKLDFNYKVRLFEKKDSLFTKVEFRIFDTIAIRCAVIHGEKIIALRDNRSFFCLRNDFSRDRVIEEKLNEMKFKNIRLVNDTLFGFNYHLDTLFYFSSQNKWLSYNKSSLYNNMLPLFEDPTYEIYNTCNGVWEGETGDIYFKDKITNKITYLMAAMTCPSSVFKINRDYYVSSFCRQGRGQGLFKDIFKISEPDELEELKGNIDPKRPIDYSKRFTESHGEISFYCFDKVKKKVNSALYQLHLYSCIPYKNKVFFLGEDCGTYLYSLSSDTVKIVDSLFKSMIFTDETWVIKSKDMTLITFQEMLKNKWDIIKPGNGFMVLRNDTLFYFHFQYFY